MEGKAVYKLIIDPDFQSLIRPLFDNEYNQLEMNLLEDGCRDPIITWNGIIIDGHNRYEICTRHQIPFYVVQKRFSCREAVVAWICSNQLGRRNLSDQTRRYLIGKQYEAEKIAIQLANASGCNQYTAPRRTSEQPSGAPQQELVPTRHVTAQRIAKENHISYVTVQKYAAYARSIEVLKKKVPDIVAKFLTGEYRLSHENVVELSALTPAEIRRVVENIESAEGPSTPAQKARQGMSQIKSKKSTPTKLAGPSVKDMPTYDPDAEVSGLVLTIPSWASSMERTLRIADWNAISDPAREKLVRALEELNKKVDELMTAAGGEADGRSE